MVLTGTDARTVRPYKSLPVGLLHVGLLQRRGFNGVGRSDGLRPTVRPYKSLLVGLLPVGSLHNTK